MILVFQLPQLPPNSVQSNKPKFAHAFHYDAEHAGEVKTRAHLCLGRARGDLTGPPATIFLPVAPAGTSLVPWPPHLPAAIFVPVAPTGTALAPRPPRRLYAPVAPTETRPRGFLAAARKIFTAHC